MFRQAWIVTVAGVFLMGCAFLLVVGCSGDTGSQPSGSQDSEVSQSAEAGSERTGLQGSESTHEVAQHGGSLEAIPPNTITDSLLRVDGITYDYLDNSGELKDKDLGPLYAEVTRQSTGSTTEEQAASNEVPVYAIKGYDTSFRLAVPSDYGPILYEVLFNPKANEVSDLLDIDGKVTGIGIAHWHGPYWRGLHVGDIEDPARVERLVRGLMDAPLKLTSPGHFGTIGLSSGPTNPDDHLLETKDLNHYGISFVLKDGTDATRDYRMDTGRLSKVPPSGVKAPASGILGIVTPQAFRQAIEQAVKGFPEQLEAQKAEELRQKSTCSDTRTTNETRRMNLNGVSYITNDVPGGPWGGVLRGTEGDDKLNGKDGEDEVHGLGGEDYMIGGACDDKIYGGSDIDQLGGSSGKDILYGGDGNDILSPDVDGERDEFYCGKGRDLFFSLEATSAEKIDYVDNSCEETQQSAIP